MSNQETSKAIIGITLITIVCKILGFLKNSVLAYYFGTDPVVDAYVMTFAIGTITSGWIAGLIGNFTPVFKQIEVHSKEQALKFGGNVFNWMYLLVLVLIIVLQVFAPQIVRTVAPGFEDETYQLTILFFRVYILSIGFYAGYRFFKEYLDCNCHHILAIYPDVFMSSLCILVIVISRYTNKTFLIWGYVIAVFVEFILETRSAKRNEFIFQKSIIFDRNIKTLLVMAVPIFLSDTLSQINTLIDKIFASSLVLGTVSAMDYANTMKDFAYQIGTIAVLTTIFPKLSIFKAENKLSEFKKLTLKAINYMSIIYIPMIIGIYILGDWIIEIVYMRGRFGTESAMMTTNSFIIYSISLIALAFRCIFLKAFYALKKTSYILIVSIVNVVLNILLNYALVEKLGYIGLALATSLASLLCLPVYFIFFKRAIEKVCYKNTYIVIFKTVVASLIMLVCLYPMKEILSLIVVRQMFKFFLLVMLTLLGAVIYFVSLKLLKIEELDELLGIMHSKMKNK